MFKDIEVLNPDSEEQNSLLYKINENPSALYDLLVAELTVVNHSIDTLKAKEGSIISMSAVKLLADTIFLCLNVLSLIEERPEELRIKSSEIESIKINAEAIIQGMEQVAVLMKRNITNIEPTALFIYLSLQEL